jgi:hypothetical protein
MKKILLIVGGGFLLIVVLGQIGKSSSTPQDDNQPESKQVNIVSPTPIVTFEYEILSRVEGKSDENISVLIKPGETNPKGLAEEVQKSCKKQCNISLFDDKKAFELDAEYTNMLSYEFTVADREAWKKKNTVFLADHLVATFGYTFGPYSEYPLKDSYYKELKGEK